MAYYDELNQKMEEAFKQLPEKGLSRTWSRRNKKATTAQGIVIDLLKIQDVVKKLLRVHGVPRNTEVKIETIGETASGCATFRDLPESEADYKRYPEHYFNKPMILISKSIYEHCEISEAMDAYCGVGLHEAAHVKETRRYFIRSMEGSLRGERQLFEGLLEDERIEETIRRDSPGYAPYVAVTKKVLFERAEFGTALKVWDSLPDLDKMKAVAFGILRCPYLLKKIHKEFQLIDGSIPFDDMCAILTHIPKTEEEVEVLGGKLMDYFAEKTKLYQSELSHDNKVGEGDSGKPQPQPAGASAPGCTGGSGSGGQSAGRDSGDLADGSPAESGEDSVDGPDMGIPAPKGLPEAEKKKRLEKQDKANKDDARQEEVIEGIKKASQNLAKTNPSQFDSPEKITEATKSNHKKKELRAASNAMKKLQNEMKKLDKGREKRFNSQEINKMVERMEGTQNPLDAGECIQLAKVLDEKLEVEEWGKKSKDGNEELENFDGSTPQKAYGHTSGRIVISQPRITPQGEKRYDLAKSQIATEIQKMKNVFRFRLGVHNVTAKEQVEGRLDRTRLGRAVTTNRIFKQTHKETSQGISVCLLLDESGSMGSAEYDRIEDSVGGYQYKAVSALKVGILLAEALKGNKGVELEVYSHTSVGWESDVLVKHLYGKRTGNQMKRIGEYVRGMGNYDDLAIQAVAKRFVQDTANENRLLIVISDGQPCSTDDKDAVQMTKKAVEEWRKKGVCVIGVAIEDFECEEIYGKKNTVKFLDISQLVRDMRKIVTSAIKEASMRRVKV
jgi:hypothetical protein